LRARDSFFPLGGGARGGTDGGTEGEGIHLIDWCKKGGWGGVPAGGGGSSNTAPVSDTRTEGKGSGGLKRGDEETEGNIRSLSVVVATAAIGPLSFVYPGLQRARPGLFLNLPSVALASPRLAFTHPLSLQLCSPPSSLLSLSLALLPSRRKRNTPGCRKNRSIFSVGACARSRCLTKPMKRLVRPVLKHGPRRLTHAQVAWWTKP